MSKFETRIPTRGSHGNIFEILGHATRRMHQLRVPQEKVQELRRKVLGAGSYEEACAAVEEWFPLEREK